MDDDFGKINNAAWILDEAGNLEFDQNVLAEIGVLRAHVDSEGKAMAAEMEQENPPYWHTA